MSLAQEKQISITSFKEVLAAKREAESVVARQIAGAALNIAPDVAAVIAEAAASQVTKTIASAAPQIIALNFTQEDARLVARDVASETSEKITAYTMSRDTVLAAVTEFATQSIQNSPELKELLAANSAIMPNLVAEVKKAITEQLTTSVNNAITQVIVDNATNGQIAGVISNYNELSKLYWTSGEMHYFKEDPSIRAAAEEYVAAEFAENCKTGDIAAIRQCLDSGMVTDIRIGAFILRSSNNHSVLANTIKTADAMFEYAESLSLPKGDPAKVAAMQKVTSLVQFVQGNDDAVIVPQMKPLAGTTKSVLDATISEEFFKLNILGVPMYKHLAANTNGTNAFELFCSRHWNAHPELIPALSHELKNEMIDFISENHARCSAFQVKMAKAITVQDYEVRLAEVSAANVEAEAVKTTEKENVTTKVLETSAPEASSSTIELTPGSAKERTKAKIAVLKAKMMQQSPEYAASQQKLFVKACQQGDTDQIRKCLDSGKIIDIREGASTLSSDDNTILAHTIRAVNILFDYTQNYRQAYDKHATTGPARINFQNIDDKTVISPEMIPRTDGIKVCVDEARGIWEIGKKPVFTVLPDLFFKLCIDGLPFYKHLSNGKEGFTTTQQLLVKDWTNPENRPKISPELKKEMMDFIMLQDDKFVSDTFKDKLKTVILQKDYEEHSVEVVEQLLHDADRSEKASFSDLNSKEQLIKLKQQMSVVDKWIGCYIEHLNHVGEVPDYTMFHHSGVRAYIHGMLLQDGNNLQPELKSHIPGFTLEQDIAHARAEDAKIVKQDIKDLGDYVNMLHEAAIKSYTDEHVEIEKAMELIKYTKNKLEQGGNLKELDNAVRAEQEVVVQHIYDIVALHPDINENTLSGHQYFNFD